MLSGVVVGFVVVCAVVCQDWLLLITHMHYRALIGSLRIVWYCHTNCVACFRLSLQIVAGVFWVYSHGGMNKSVAGADIWAV